MITGLIDQTKLNIQDADYGGELDSGGQDERGNPIGGQMYATAFNSDYQQIKWWTEFIGSNQCTFSSDRDLYQRLNCIPHSLHQDLQPQRLE